MSIWDELEDCYNEIADLKWWLDDADKVIASLYLENWCLRATIKELEEREAAND